MSRRNQTRRRRTYGRRQHEVRERRPGDRGDVAWLGDGDAEMSEDWQAAEASDDQSAFGDPFGSYAR